MTVQPAPYRPGEAVARQGHSCLVTHASIAARPFFEKQSYQAVKEQQVKRRGVLLTNFVMEKVL